MSKLRVARVPKPTHRVTTITVGAAMAIAAALALPHANGGDRDCLLFQARLETSEYPALDLRLCAIVPAAGGAVVVRYDVVVRVAMMPARPR
jgi:hypothetical protein